MFPGVTLPGLDVRQNEVGLQSGTTQAMLESMSYVYATGISKQIIGLQEFALSIFHELDEDFAKIDTRVKQLSMRLQDFQRSADSFIAINKHLPFKSYLKNPEQDIPIPTLAGLRAGMPGQGSIFLEKAATVCDPPTSLEAFAPVVPDWQSAQMMISDSRFYLEQYQRELKAEFQKAVEAEQNRPKAKEKKKGKTASVDQSAAALQNFLEGVPLPEVRVVVPPPPGMPANWRAPAESRSAPRAGRAAPAQRSDVMMVNQAAQTQKRKLKHEYGSVFSQRPVTRNMVRQQVVMFNRDVSGAQPNYEAPGFAARITSSVVKPEKSRYEPVLMTSERAFAIDHMTVQDLYLSSAYHYEYVNMEAEKQPEKHTDRS